MEFAGNMMQKETAWAILLKTGRWLHEYRQVPTSFHYVNHLNSLRYFNNHCIFNEMSLCIIISYSVS